jgi:hypothetical protein
MKKKEINILPVSFEKEQEDTIALVSKIKNDGWFSSSVILVNCMPEYSSRLIQSMNHMFSLNNRNELLEIMDLAIPFPSFNQVWNPLTKNYENFDTYLKNWINEFVYPNQFLFVCTKPDSGRALNKLRLSLRSKLENEQFRFATMYLPDNCTLIPDYII